MWTYLTLFSGALALIVVFAHRAFVLYRKSRGDEAPLKKPKPEGFGKSPEKEKKTLKGKAGEVEGLYQKGMQLLQSGKEEDAIKLFVQALAIDDSHPETLQNLALLYMQKQMFNAAAALYKQLCEKKEDPVHYSHLGFALYQQNELEDAREAYQKAIDLDDSRPQRFVSLAQVYRSLEEPHLAIIATKKALDMDEENVDFLFLLSDLLVEKGDLADAKAVLEKILTLAPENEEAKKILKGLKKTETDSSNTTAP